MEEDSISSSANLILDNLTKRMTEALTAALWPILKDLPIELKTGACKNLKHFKNLKEQGIQTEVLEKDPFLDYAKNPVSRDPFEPLSFRDGTQDFASCPDTSRTHCKSTLQIQTSNPAKLTCTQKDPIF